MTERTIGLEKARARVRQAASFDTVHLGYTYYLWIFVICSVIGLVLETVVSIPIDGELRHRAGLIWGPFSPIYGLGAVLLTLTLKPLNSKNPIIMFLVGALIGGAFEYCASLFLESMYGFVAWSYQGMPFNISGRTCLGIACAWGVLGMVWVKLLLPRMIRLIDRIPTEPRRFATIALSLFMAVDVAFTLVAFNCWFERQSASAETPIETYFAQRYDDDFMKAQFGVISMWPELAQRQGSPKP